MKWKKSSLLYGTQLPSPRRWGAGAILIYDKYFERQPAVAAWLQKFERRYGVKSGEKLKNLDLFPGHLKKILGLSEGLPTKEITIIVLGGGSVGDFGGFIASILKRGVRLVQIPSTWLAAIDSAHGGKTGLNVSKIKNQIGTFYSADEIHLVKNLLEGQPRVRLLEAVGEALKISLLEGRTLWRDLHQEAEVTSKLFWKQLPAMVQAKYRIVAKDPFEENGARHALNLGHTAGHVWESQLKIPHGIAVLYGTAFALEWSLQRKIISSKNYYYIRLSEFGAILPDRLDLERILRRTKNPRRFLLQDKKISTNKRIRFVFIAAPGKPVIESVTLSELLSEMKRQAR